MTGQAHGSAWASQRVTDGTQRRPVGAVSSVRTLQGVEEGVMQTDPCVTGQAHDVAWRMALHGASQWVTDDTPRCPRGAVSPVSPVRTARDGEGQAFTLRMGLP